HSWKTPSSLAENFHEKAKKYGGLEVPLIVAGVKHYRAETHVTEVEDVLFGGVFDKRPELSAAPWVQPHSLPVPRVAFWANPKAARALPTQFASDFARASL